MPKIATKEKPKTTPKTTTSAVAPVKDAGPPKIKHPEIKVLRQTGDKALTGRDAATLLGLVTEQQNATAKAKEAGLEATPDVLKSIKLTAFHFKDDDGRPVYCHNITRNRSIDAGVVRAHRQDILTRCWAGPTILPEPQKFVYEGKTEHKMADGRVLQPGDEVELVEGTANGEAIIIGRDGQVVSGQKRLIALWQAWQDWLANPERWGRLWPKNKHPDGPVMDTLVIFGVSNHPKIIQTLDNVQARSEADTFETTGAAQRILGIPEDKVDPKKRQEVCRMLQTALDFVWNRSGQNDRQAKTNRAAQDFLDRHPKIYKAVKIVFDLNVGRTLSLPPFRLSPGTCAAALWLMAQGKTKPGKWRDSEAAAASEDLLDTSLWVKAEEFWTKAARREGLTFNLLADALARLVSLDGEELQGNAVQKFCMVAKTWRLWLGGKKVSKEDMTLETFKDAKNIQRLLNPPDFGGIDRGPRTVNPEEIEDEPTEEEVKARADAIRAANGHGTTRAPDEVAKPAPKPVGKDGKPLPVKALPAA